MNFIRSVVISELVLSMLCCPKTITDANLFVNDHFICLFCYIHVSNFRQRVTVNLSHFYDVHNRIPFISVVCTYYYKIFYQKYEKCQVCSDHYCFVQITYLDCSLTSTSSSIAAITCFPSITLEY